MDGNKGRWIYQLWCCDEAFIQVEIIALYVVKITMESKQLMHGCICCSLIISLRFIMGIER